MEKADRVGKSHQRSPVPVAELVRGWIRAAELVRMRAPIYDRPVIWDNQQIAAVALGLSLVVFFAGTTAAVAAGATPPTPLWAAGGAVSGGLLGLLLPGPVPNAVRNAAIDAKARAMTARAADPAAAAAAPAAADPEVEAAARSTSWWTVGALAGVFVLLLILSVCLAGGAIVPPASFGAGSLQNLTKTVIAMTSAAGTGMIGLLVPSK